jgi:chromosome segregation ATPase
MSDKLFTFNAGSFSLEAPAEDLLRSKGAIALDFGSAAYINANSMPAILSELAERSAMANSLKESEAMVAQLKVEISKFSSERQKLMEDNAALVSQLQSATVEVASLREQAANSAKAIEALKAENAKILSTPVPVPPAPDESLKQEHEKLLKESHQLRNLSAEAITSLKVLEGENEELRKELDTLRNQLKNAAPKEAAALQPKADAPSKEVAAPPKAG